MDELSELPVTDDAWRTEVLVVLRGIWACLGQAPWMQEAPETPDLPGTRESVAVSRELPEASEPLATWILTDQSVARVEEAIEAEQRVRGRAYGG